MIRHIVLFKMNNTVAEEETKALARELETLKEKTEGLMQECVVAFDLVHAKNSCNLVLNSTFNSLSDLEKYQVHPEHVKVVKKIKKLCSSTMKVDYQI